MELYQDQFALLSRVRNEFRRHRRVLMQAPTGFGKTVCAGKLMHQLSLKDNRVLVTVHREELQEQFYRTLAAVGLADDVGLIAGGLAEQSWRPHQIASVFTLARRLERTRLRPTFIIVDEAHHATANTWSKILGRWPKAYVLGMTATPERPDGAGLGVHFDSLVIGPSTRELIDLGRLAPYRIFRLEGVDSSGIRKHSDFVRKELDSRADGRAIASIVRAVEEHANDKRTLIFSVSVRASELVAHQLREKGLRAEHFDGNTDKTKRRQLVRDFKAGELDQLCSVDLVNEGFDVEGCDCVVLARPTNSIVLYLQQIGRALRYQEGKTALILDCTYPPVTELFGPPCIERPWSLDGKTMRRQQSISLPPVCLTCGCLLSVGQTHCDRCGTKRPVQPRDNKPVLDVSLVEVDIAGFTIEVKKTDGKFDRKDVQGLAREAWTREGVAGLRALGKQLGYKPGWAEHQVAMRTQGRHKMPAAGRMMRRSKHGS